MSFPDLFHLVCAQSCLILCSAMDCSLPGSSVHRHFQSGRPGVGCHFLLQGMLSTQGSNPCLLDLLHWQVDSLPQCHLGRPSHSIWYVLVEVMEFQLSYSKSWKMMLWKCCTQYLSKFGKLSSGHRTGKGPFSFQSPKKAMPKNAQTTTQLHSSHTPVK